MHQLYIKCHFCVVILDLSVTLTNTQYFSKLISTLSFMSSVNLNILERCQSSKALISLTAVLSKLLFYLSIAGGFMGFDWKKSPQTFQSPRISVDLRLISVKYFLETIDISSIITTSENLFCKFTVCHLLDKYVFCSLWLNQNELFCHRYSQVSRQGVHLLEFMLSFEWPIFDRIHG